MLGQLDYSVAAIIILLFLGGIALFQSPRTARLGGWLNIFAYTAAVVFVLVRYPLMDPTFVLLAVILGGTIGALLAAKVAMINVPQMVAFQHGCGGIAAFLIAFSEFTTGGADLTVTEQVSSVLGMVVGAVTFSGSLIAAGKLAKIVEQRPMHWPGQTYILTGLSILTLVLCIAVIVAVGQSVTVGLAISLIILSILIGVVFTSRIGGADMPVIISFFNATSGFAASFVGIAVNNFLLIGCGACVAASGSLLTLSMCRAMNRSVVNVLLGTRRGGKNAAVLPETETVVKEAHDNISPLDKAVSLLKSAKDVIIVPGYGMAVSQAQDLVHSLEQRLEKQGAKVRYAIHPVAGRMPGHMNVLLAEVGVGYDKLFEMDAINNEFNKADLTLVVGACDVVNPAATSQQNTPISGMPILKVHEAKAVIVLNMDDKPGFSGVANPLYTMKQVIPIWGDAKQNIEALLYDLSK